MPILPFLPRLDTHLLLAHVMNKPRAWLLAHPETNLSTDEQTRLEAALAQLTAGVPLPYILEHWEFFGLDFAITPDVLIPRPETELLVEFALLRIGAHPETKLAVDVGTGSGCIAITLAVHLPHLHLLAVDRSLPALLVARDNARAHAVVGQIDFLQADLLSAVQGQIDLLLANLPYIPTQTLRGLDVFGREPTLALDGGPDGLDLIRRLLGQAVNRLAPGALALLEIEATQGDAVLGLARQNFPQAVSQVLPDLAGFDRLLTIEIPTR